MGSIIFIIVSLYPTHFDILLDKSLCERLDDIFSQRNLILEFYINDVGLRSYYLLYKVDINLRTR